MTDSVREQIIAALVTALEGITGFTGLTVERDRDTEVSRFPTLVVLAGNQTADAGSGNLVTEYRMTVAVAGFTKPAASSDPATKAAHALYAAAVKAALADPTLGGLCVDITEGETQFGLDSVEGHARLGSFETQFEILFFAATGDPAAAANP
jgi:hypothetical protein